jgi:hypothetical protein
MATVSGSTPNLGVLSCKKIPHRFLGKAAGIIMAHELAHHAVGIELKIFPRDLTDSS